MAARRSPDRRVPRAAASASSSASSATPFAMLVVADLLGVPGGGPREVPATSSGVAHGGRSGAPTATAIAHSPLEFLYERFADYVEDRRANPRDDVLTGLATATFPDGSHPRGHRRRAGRGRTCSRPGRRPRSGCSATALQLIGRAARAPAAAPRRARPHPELRRGGPAVREPGEGRLPPVAGADHRRRGGHPRRDDGDGRQRRGQPRPGPVRGPRRVRGRPGQRPPAPRRSATARTPARARRSRAPRGRWRWPACSSGRPTSRSRRRTTDRPTRVATTTCRRTSSGACSALHLEFTPVG